MEDLSAPLIHRLPEDLRTVLENDPVAQRDWDALPEAQKSQWLTYLAEGREPARRAIRIANLLMAVTDG